MSMMPRVSITASGAEAHGDAIKWLREKDGLDFPNAVRTLAREIGFAPPPAPRPRTPEQRQAEDKRARLLRLMESATRYYTAALQADTPAARKARRYLSEDRGLSPTTLAEFRLGYAPSNGGALLAHLREAGFKDSEILATGLARRQETLNKGLGYRQDQGNLRTFFFDRLLFPIADGRGQVVSFGGRALSDTATAKYINGADSEIFSKGRLLYNLHQADSPIRKGAPAWVVEGYMDVIALAEAGIASAVAPLGTSMTADQWQLLFKRSDAPVLCMDGDSAGRRAAIRAADTALPLLVAGKSPRFVFLPDGRDPDDILRNAQNGKETFSALGKTALSLADLLWSANTQGFDFTAPEKVALLDRDLTRLTEQIADPSLRRAYKGELKARLNNALWETRKRATAPNAHRQSHSPASAPAKISDHASALRANLSHNRALREIRPLAMVLRDPWLAAEFYEKLTDLPNRVPAIARLREAVLDILAEQPDLDSQALAEYLKEAGFSSTLTQAMASQAFAPQGAGRAELSASSTHSQETSQEENWAFRGQSFEQDSESNNAEEGAEGAGAGAGAGADTGATASEGEEARRAQIREEFKKTLAYCQAGESQFISFWRARGSAALTHLARRDSEQGQEDEDDFQAGDFQEKRGFQEKGDGESHNKDHSKDGETLHADGRDRQ